MPPPLLPCLVGAPGHWIRNKPTQRSTGSCRSTLELRWFTAVFANVSARPFVGGTCSTHKALAWANHALATAVRWRSAGKCKICLSWKTPITSSESPKTTADAMSDSATHWQAVAKAVNSATLLDIAPDNHICQRRRALMGLWRTRRRSLVWRYRWIRCYARLR